MCEKFWAMPVWRDGGQVGNLVRKCRMRRAVDICNVKAPGNEINNETSCGEDWKILKPECRERERERNGGRLKNMQGTARTSGNESPHLSICCE